MSLKGMIRKKIND